MLTIYRLVEILFIIISFTASITIYFRKNISGYLKFFPPFLLITVVVEIFGFKLANRNVNNFLLYNFFSIFEFVFYFFIQSHFFSKGRIRRIILTMIWLYPVIALIDVFGIEGIKRFHVYSYSLGALAVVVFSIFYFFELFYRNSSFYNVLKSPIFWINCALFIFYSISLPLFAALNFIAHFSFSGMRVMGFILEFANYLLYTLFTIAFLVRPGPSTSDLRYSHRPPVR